MLTSASTITNLLESSVRCVLLDLFWPFLFQNTHNISYTRWSVSADIQTRRSQLKNYEIFSQVC